MTTPVSPVDLVVELLGAANGNKDVVLLALATMLIAARAGRYAGMIRLGPK